MALDRCEEAVSDVVPRPHDPVDGRRVRQQPHRVESSFGHVGQIALVAVVPVSVQLVQELLDLVEQE